MSETIDTTAEVQEEVKPIDAGHIVMKLTNEKGEVVDVMMIDVLNQLLRELVVIHKRIDSVEQSTPESKIIV